jgi:drug/metabolite transporter (DMT)-like permease
MNEAPTILRRRAVVMLVLANLYWGLSFPLIKSITAMNRALMPDAGTWFVAASALAPRFLLAAVIVRLFKRSGEAGATRSEIRQGVGIGLFAAGGTFLQTDGLQHTAASTSAFLTQFSAILIPAWLALRDRRNPGAVVWTCCVLVLVGVAILGHFDWHALGFGRGEWETLLCSLFFMGQILWLARPEFAGNRPGPVTAAMFSVEAAAFVALAAASTPSVRDLGTPWESPVWVALTLVLTVVCTMGAFTLMNRWQPVISSTEAGLVYCIEPLFAAIFALFLPGLLSAWAVIEYPNEHATWSLVVGGALVTFANVLIQLRHTSNGAAAVK